VQGLLQTRVTEQFGNDAAGIATLLARLRDLPIALVLMQATGGSISHWKGWGFNAQAGHP